jgi:hypothetical protein
MGLNVSRCVLWWVGVCVCVLRGGGAGWLAD